MPWKRMLAPVSAGRVGRESGAARRDAQLLSPPSRLTKFKARLCDPSVASGSRRLASRHTGLEVPDDLAEPKRRVAPVINRAGRFGMDGRISSNDY